MRRNIIFYICHLLFWNLFCIFRYGYFDLMPTFLWVLISLIFLVSYLLSLLLNTGLKDGKDGVGRRAFKIQVILAVLWALFAFYIMFNAWRENNIAKETINECAEVNKDFIWSWTLADDSSNNFNLTMLAIDESIEELDKMVKKNVELPTDTIYCLTTLNHEKITLEGLDCRRITIVYELPRRSKYYKAIYLWNSEDCILTGFNEVENK